MEAQEGRLVWCYGEGRIVLLNNNIQGNIGKSPIIAAAQSAQNEQARVEAQTRAAEARESRWARLRASSRIIWKWNLITTRARCAAAFSKDCL